MKVRSPVDPNWMFSINAEKLKAPAEQKHSDSGSGYREQYERQQEKKDQTPEEKDQELRSAISQFREDDQLQTLGMTAQMEGSGPGLKVILKDGNGTIVRQMTGEEFVKLRQNIGKKSKDHGKLLDQKF